LLARELPKPTFSKKKSNKKTEDMQTAIQRVLKRKTRRRPIVFLISRGGYIKILRVAGGVLCMSYMCDPILNFQPKPGPYGLEEPGTALKSAAESNQNDIRTKKQHL
jgi:hypothetical protein